MTQPEAGPVVAIVLAAGLGKRMRSEQPKVLHPVGGRAMLARVLEALRDAGVPAVTVVVGNGAAAVRAAAEGWQASLHPLRVAFALQERQGGTGHATIRGLEALPPTDAADILVLNGDTPLLAAGQIRDLLEAHAAGGGVATLLTAVLPDASGYGRILRDAAGAIRGIVEDRDATPTQRGIREVNTGVGCFRRTALAAALARCTPANAQGELYLTDVVADLVAGGHAVGALATTDWASALGVNDRRALAEAERLLRQRTQERLLDGGVTIVDPANTYVADTVQIGQDCVLEPGTILEGSCDIASGCTLGPAAHIRDSVLGPECVVRQSVVEGSRLGRGVHVGPFAHLRPGSLLGDGVEVGNFAEVKNARLGPGVKQHHHSYIGDAEVGAAVNVGAGVITANFDGLQKHRTVIGEGAFLGCNANLVAPVEVGAGAVVAAGTTLTKTAPPDSLVVGRARPTVKEGWAAARRGGRSRERES